jgi:hypothetical protein
MSAQVLSDMAEYPIPNDVKQFTLSALIRLLNWKPCCCYEAVPMKNGALKRSPKGFTSVSRRQLLCSRDSTRKG